MKNRNYAYTTAYARKILSKQTNNNTQKERVKPIDKHGDYNGTDTGFTSKSIEKPHRTRKVKQQNRKKPIDHHGNYAGTDVGFTAKFKK